MKTRFLIIIPIIIAFVLVSFAIPNLSKVYDSCEMAQDGTLQFAIGYQWTNGLLYIDNAECIWKLFGVIPIASILDDKITTASDNTVAQLEAILEHCIDSKDLVDTVGLSYYNDTHSIDTENCEWKIIDNFDATFGGLGNRHPAFLGWDIPDVCTKDMVKFLKKHSNMFDNDIPYMSPLDGSVLEYGIDADDIVQCGNELLDNRDNEPSWPGK